MASEKPKADAKLDKDKFLSEDRCSEESLTMKHPIRGTYVAKDIVITKKAKNNKGDPIPIYHTESTESKLDSLFGDINLLNERVSNLVKQGDINAAVKLLRKKIDQHSKLITILDSQQNYYELAKTKKSNETLLSRREGSSSSRYTPKVKVKAESTYENSMSEHNDSDTEVEEEASMEKEIKAVEEKAAATPGHATVGEFLIKILKDEVDMFYAAGVHKLCKKYLKAKGRKTDVTAEMLANHRVRIKNVVTLAFLVK